MQINIDPVAFYIFSFPVRWYALAYVAGIVLGSMMAKRVAQKLETFNSLYIDQLISWIVIGIILGGRLGHVIFYDLEFFSNNPIEIFKLWNGGMSFHGGFIGVVISTLIFCKLHSIKPLNLFDALSVAAPIGLFFGRLANFINGELYGRVWHSEFAFRFADHITRHPSQLYEAFSEGIILFLVEIYVCFFTNLSKKNGTLSGIFCVLYGLSRCICEIFREPDSDINYIILAQYGITIGQILSIPLILFGCYILISANMRNKK